MTVIPATTIWSDAVREPALPGAGLRELFDLRPADGVPSVPRLDGPNAGRGRIRNSSIPDDMTNEDEIWKDIPGWEGLYQASNEGEIRCLFPTRAKRGGSEMSPPGRVIAVTRRADGYLSATLRSPTDKRGKTLLTHRLVLCAFTGADLRCLWEVDHLDGDRGNNAPSNLRWVDRGVNCQNRNRARGASSVVGVSYAKHPRHHRSPWQARVKLDGRCIQIGSFPTEAEAIAARKKWEVYNSWNRK